MNRLRRGRPNVTRARIGNLRAGEPDLAQLVLGIVLVLAALVGFVYTLTL